MVAEGCVFTDGSVALRWRGIGPQLGVCSATGARQVGALAEHVTAISARASGRAPRVPSEPSDPPASLAQITPHATPHASGSLPLLLSGRTGSEPLLGLARRQ
ncbi:hypothetical protein GCM10009741_68040 [Kribbella lupini]|uniref:Uncharacterized protein n=1 Tax=Kribbella lupini TaxID=291602 RepID=A0ABN2C9B1_9ACTN